MKKAVIHIDGDSFFASCEISLNPKLRGKPVVTGQERGIATAMSKEAKALGISRGMPIFQVKKNFPQAVIVNSNYHTYGIFAQRMYDIVRRYTDRVEEYSIDECFGLLYDSEGLIDITATAREIKEALHKELGMSFSLGVAPTKVLAKVASKWHKPDGFTVITPETIREFLDGLLVSHIWGIGPAMSQRLYSQGVRTALDLIDRPLKWIEATQHKHVHRHEISLDLPTTSPSAIMHEIRASFDAVYRPGAEYRATGVTLGDLRPSGLSQNDLFGEVVKNERWSEIYKLVDLIDRRYGTRTMRLAASSRAWQRRGVRPTRRLQIPYMGEVA